MEPSGLTWAVCGSLACRGIGPVTDGLYRKVRGSAEGYNLSLCSDFHGVPFMEVGWAPAEFPASGGCTSKNHREGINDFFVASHIWGLFPTSPFALLSDLRRSFCLASIITCLPDPFKNSGFNLSHAVFVSSLAWVTQTRATRCCCSVATQPICQHPSKCCVYT